MFLLFAALLVQEAAYAISDPSQILPHPDCIYVNQDLYCGRSYMRLPSTFDAEEIPPDTSSLFFVCISPRDDYCTIIEEDFDPLPYRKNLTSVVIEGMRSATDRRLPVSLLLQNLKNSLQQLVIRFSKIGYLDAEFLDGFNRLQTLELPMNDISDILVGTFSPFRYNCVSGLELIDLSGNKIEVFDWSVIQPVADKLKALYLSNQTPKLRTVHHSGVKFEHVLRIICLDGNNLSHIPGLVLEFVQSHRETYLNFFGNDFCPNHADCSCCEMKDFVIRLHAIVEAGPIAGVLLSCGSGPRLTAYVNASLPAVAAYSSCEDIKITPRVCKTAPPLTVTCDKGNMSFSETDFDKTDALTVVMRGDTTVHCRMILHDAFQNLVDVATLRLRKQSRPLLDRETVEAHCATGTVRLDAHPEYFDEENFDPDHYSARKLTFEIDTSHACRVQLTAFLHSLFELNTKAHESAPTTIIPVSSWLETSLICSDEPPLQVVCRKDVLEFPYTDAQETKALSLTIKTDGSYRCMDIVGLFYANLTEERFSIIRPQVNDGLDDTIVSVCQKGVLVTSDRHPQLSAKSGFEIYSAPNLLCRESFVKVLEWVTSSSVTA